MPCPRKLVVVVFLLVVAGAIAAAVQREPWDPDETRYLRVTDELLQGGNPLFLTFNGEPFTDKPPLFFWLLAPIVQILGPTSALAGVFPSLLALAGLAVAVGRLGRTAGLAPDVARWGTVLTLSSLLPAVITGVCRMDLLFALWCTLALGRLAALTHDHPRRSDHLMLWVWIALGVLTKGPIAIALPLLAAACMAPFDRRPFRHAVVGWGPLAALGIVGAWLAPATWLGGWPWFDAVVIHQAVGRLVSSFAHREPWWYHFATVPLSLLPWSPAVLPASVVAFTQRHALGPAARVLAVYTATTLVLLSLLSGKTVLYPLPLFPPACLVAAWWLSRNPRRPSRRICVAAGGAVMTAVGIVLATVVAPRPDMALSPVATIVLASSLVLPGVLAFAAAVVGRSRQALVALSLTVPIFVAIGVQTLVSPFDRLLSLKPLAVALAEVEAASTSPALAFARIQPGYLLFTGRRFALLNEPAELDEALRAGRVVVIDAKEANRLGRQGHGNWTVAAEIPYRHTSILLVAGVD